MTGSVFLHYVVGDLTVGKPDLAEFPDSGTVESAIRALSCCSEASLTVWRTADCCADGRSADRFLGLLTAAELVTFLASAGEESDRALRTPLSEVVLPNPGVLKEVDPGTRLIDALEMMKQGVQRLLVRKSITWKGASKRFSILYDGKWLKNLDSASNNICTTRPSSYSIPQNKYCCLSREDVLRFIIGCLGALNPIPLSSISSLGAITPHYSYVEASSPALEAARNLPQDPCAVAVVETSSDGTHKIIGEISSYKFWKCDYLAVAWVMTNLSAGQFVMGVVDSEATQESAPGLTMIPPVEEAGTGTSLRSSKFSSRNIGFFSRCASPMTVASPRSMYRGRSMPLTCKHTSSLAAVMAQMLSHRATHVWVTEAEAEDDILIGVVSYIDILFAVTKYPISVPSVAL